MAAHLGSFIFDLDGTLVDSLAGIEASANHALQLCLPGTCVPQLREQIGPPIAKMFRRLFPDQDEETMSALVAAFRQHYDTTGCRLSQLYPQVRETLAELAHRSAAMFVLTNKPQHATRVILEHNDVLKYFAEVVSPDSSTPAFATKIEAARAMHQRLQLEPEGTAIVGDGADDFAAAAACGFTFIFAEYGYGSAAAVGATQSCTTIRSFGELLSLPPK